jgi:RNA polymerase sigma-70 factor, ECF subfamily
LKVLTGDPHTSVVKSAALKWPTTPHDLPTDRPKVFEDIYDQTFDEVLRWLRSLGVPESEWDDLAQEVFLIVRRQLPRFDGQNLKGWLFRITQRTARDYRRGAWFQRFFHRDAHLDAVAHRPSSEPGPEQALESKERRVAFERAVSALSEKRRVCFVLFEVEGYSGEEISEMLRVPVATVWTRLHHARKDFLRAAAAEVEGGAP